MRKYLVEDERKNTVPTVVKIAVFCVSLAAIAAAVLVIIKKWAEIKQALKRLKDTAVYTCEDFDDEDFGDLDDCDCCDCDDCCDDDCCCDDGCGCDCDCDCAEEKADEE